MVKKKEDVILWKVVHNTTRQSIIVGRDDTKQEIADRFVLTYEKGTVVRAKRGSFGCFCFDDEYFARHFAKEKSNAIVIRVKAVGTKKPTPSYIPRLRFFYLKTVLSIIKNIKIGVVGYDEIWEVPNHTVCYTAVEVLD